MINIIWTVHNTFKYLVYMCCVKQVKRHKFWRKQESYMARAGRMKEKGVMI